MVPASEGGRERASFSKRSYWNRWITGPQLRGKVGTPAPVRHSPANDDGLWRLALLTPTVTGAPSPSGLQGYYGLETGGKRPEGENERLQLSSLPDVCEVQVA